MWIRTPDGGPSEHCDFGWSAEVYSEYVLLRTLAVLRDREWIDVPEDVEELVESVYDDSVCLNVSAEFAQRLESAGKQFRKKLERLRFQARDRLVKGPGFDGELAEVGGGELEDANPDVHRAFRALTRWSDVPSVSLVCLHGTRENAYLDANMTERVELAAEPDERTVGMLMGRSVDVAGHSIADYFGEAQAPRPWRKIAALRYRRPAFFENGMLRGRGFTLVLDEELGVVVEHGDAF